VLGAGDHGDVPFQRVVDAITPNRDSSRHPLFQPWLVVHNSDHLRIVSLPGLTITAIPSEPSTPVFDLALAMTHGRAALFGNLTYDASLLAEEAAAGIVEAFGRLLTRVLIDPTVRVDELQLDLRTEVASLRARAPEFRL
jgi:non-ribosomal peptide synthetase component F